MGAFIKKHLALCSSFCCRGKTFVVVEVEMKNLLKLEGSLGLIALPASFFFAVRILN
jgi:hypothetical protein